MAISPRHRPSASAQHGARLRLDWSLAGLAALTAGPAPVVVVVVDVLPYRWADQSAQAFAAEHDAVLAVGRTEPGVSLSPASVRREGIHVRRLVLPSPNGATVVHEAARAGATVMTACLRNATAGADRVGCPPMPI